MSDANLSGAVQAARRIMFVVAAITLIAPSACVQSITFTCLHEGNTPENRDGMRAFLDVESNRNTDVSIDTSDCRLDAKLNEVLIKNPAADTTAVKRFYLAYLWQCTSAYRDFT